MDTINVVGKYLVGADESLVFSNTYGFTFGYNDGHIDKLVIAGSVLVTDTQNYTVRGVYGAYYYGPQAFVNAAHGSLVVEAKYAYGPGAVGVELVGSITNRGFISVTSVSGNAEGLVGYDAIDNSGRVEVFAGQSGFGVETQGGDLVNSGLIHVSGEDSIGVRVYEGGGVDNRGDIRVEGSGAVVTGVDYSRSYYTAPDAFFNSGTIVVQSSGSGTAIGLMLGGYSYYSSGLRFFNSGLIQADVAIRGGGPYDQFNIIRNSGQIVGDIQLGFAADTIVNKGVIEGVISLGLNHDTYDGSHGKLIGELRGGLGDDTLIGGKGADQIYGDDKIDSGQDGSDLIFGGGGNDNLHGEGGADTLVGGAGADILVGGYGHDVFLFQDVSDSGPNQADVIADLKRLDRIDLSGIDADTSTSGDQAFHLVKSFGGHAGELTLTYDADSGSTFISGDIDGDGVADLVIRVIGDQTAFTGFVL